MKFILQNITGKSKFIIKFTFLFLLLFSPAILKAGDEIEIVESAPAETVYENSPVSKSFDVWMKMIKDAGETIDIETFYFADEKNEPLEKIIDALKQSAAKGVKIRIIVDSSFYSRNDKSVDSLEGIENISIRKIPFGNLGGGVMHAKFFIVDNENLFMGSQNFDWRALKHIHEMGVRVKNKIIAGTFAEVFETDWKLCEGNAYGLMNQKAVVISNSENPVTVNSDKYGKVVVYPAFSPPQYNFPGLSTEENELIKIIENTRDRLNIQIYSFSDKEKSDTAKFDVISNALKRAGERGVKIRIIIPDWAMKDYSEEFLKDLSLSENIEIKISSIPLFSGGFIPYSRVDHSKYFISDNDLSWISTSNWESGYFRNSRNATLVIKNPEVNKELLGVFELGWTSPYTEKIDVNKKYESVKRN
ncbi:MAG: hypothetical protein JSS91_00385 [Bacteroidetes bacterium]|nr:hypothetical protein [Bacteroidota bacterium]